ncbi:MAG TPA: hypothetical protein VFD39_00415, partial [Trueperaceae bacterium]|nr:hypothetical protein [Trueperaceae bacterium]
PYRHVHDEGTDLSSTPPPIATATLPPHLPIPWSDPLDSTRFFERDFVHFPQPVTCLERDFIGLTVVTGMRRTVEKFNAPLRLDLRRFWTHLYWLDVFYCDPAEVLMVWTTTTRTAFAPVLEDLEAYWLGVWLPEIRTSQAFWAAFDLANASNEALLTHLAESLTRITRIWELHFEIVYAVGHGWELFTELYGELFEGTSKLDAARLLQGIDNLTTAAGRGIWRLRELAAASPDLAGMIADSEPAGLLDRLETRAQTLPEAAALLSELRGYLTTLGRRSTSFSLRSKTLLEDPTPVLSQLKDALANPDADPDRHRETRVAQREQAIAEARGSLRHYPQVLRAEFERRLTAAQVATRLKEDHNFIIDYQCTAAVRAVIMELAGRLATAGEVDSPDDVMHLTFNELQASGLALGSLDPGRALGSPDAAASAADRRALVAARAAEMALRRGRGAVEPGEPTWAPGPRGRAARR